jgi:hypothetical protein
MWTGSWWHVVQVRRKSIYYVWFISFLFQNRLPSGRTVAPVIIATDKTQLTQFSGGKSAYPIYLTLGNIPKSVRRKPTQHACVLVGYLSVDKISRNQLTNQEKRARNQRLFHESMRVILAPLKREGEEGIELTGGDGSVRRVHPILATYVADYPEQCLVACTKYGTCPKCQCRAVELQDASSFPSRTQAWTTQIIEDDIPVSQVLHGVGGIWQCIPTILGRISTYRYSYRHHP